MDGDAEEDDMPVEESDRASGPSAVGQVREGPIVLVLDPAGEAPHGTLPATWHELTAHRSVVWCRLATEGALARADDLLAEPDIGANRVDVVASGPTADAAFELIARRPNPVRSLLLVDPAATQVDHTDGDPAGAPIADARWVGRVQPRIRELEGQDVTVRVVAHSVGGSRDRIGPPLPLGHPDVLTAVRDAVETLDQGEATA